MRHMADTVDSDTRLRSLYSDHRAAVDAYCRRRLPSSAVADAVSEVFLIAWRRIEDIPDGAELPWLYGVARNVVLNQQRSRQRRTRLSAMLMSQPAPDHPDSEVLVVRRLEDRLVLEALSTLGHADQEVLRLRAWEELSSAEIGLALGISASAVDMRLTRAKRRLKRALRSVGYFETVSSPRIVKNGGLS